LPPEFANDPERKGRFKRESQLLASLNHTNLAGIYGLEEIDGMRTLVMERAGRPALLDQYRHRRVYRIVNPHRHQLAACAEEVALFIGVC
jgi:serine/threonine protein kinase